MTMHTEPLSIEEPIIVMTRRFSAPRETVWRVLTDPKHVVKWYGGHGFENPVCEMDVRPGGRWRHVMRPPGGPDFPMESVFVEVVPPSRIVWKNADYDAAAPGHPVSINTVTLEAVAPRETAWKLVTRFKTLAARDAAVKMGFSHVLGEGCEKLEAIVRGLDAA